LKFIDVDYERRKPREMQPKLTADVLTQLDRTTPKAKKSKGSNTPIGEVIGLMSGL